MNYARLQSLVAAMMSQMRIPHVIRRSFRATPCFCNDVAPAVSIESIKSLRQRTGAPITAVKTALVAENGDEDAALDHLRKLGAKLAAKRAHRDAVEGLVALRITPDRKAGSLIELSCETDFVARTERFQELASSFASAALAAKVKETGSIDPEILINSEGFPEQLAEASAALGENLRLRRACVMHTDGNDSGIFGYVHTASASDVGRIGVLVALNGPKDEIGCPGRRLAMHIAAASPKYLRKELIPNVDIEKERDLLLQVARTEDKNREKPRTDDILQKMVQGRLQKWYQQVVLEDQEMLVEDQKYSGSPRSVLKSIESDCSTCRIEAFTRYSVN